MPVGGMGGRGITKLSPAFPVAYITTHWRIFLLQIVSLISLHLFRVFFTFKHAHFLTDASLIVFYQPEIDINNMK